jgi:hypothetical protein
MRAGRTPNLAKMEVNYFAQQMQERIHRNESCYRVAVTEIVDQDWKISERLMMFVALSLLPSVPCNVRHSNCNTSHFGRVVHYTVGRYGSVNPFSHSPILVFEIQQTRNIDLW